ncbi:podoplanin isoform X1 [Amphiprion ocellaris]|uniref:podoplanin isoform X1 n=1 Tax=Amphiprion ocellaris TaxID=80972 RepID=UPI001649EEA1|nr:podoplanin isoform X1 [Amphiprion ocellaris]
MKVQLLLLLALAGPFCAFTRASPTELPADTTEEIPVTAAVPDATNAAKEELITLVTGPPATEPAAAPEELMTEVVTEAAPATTVIMEEAVAETEGPVASTAAAPEPLVTDAPVVTEAPTEAAEVPDVPAEATAAVETNEEVVVEEGSEDGLSSGQVVGIVIGALLAVVIVIAVVIAVVRRMGKYSSAKNKKPAKKDSIMVSALRKKSAKQQERAKFWKF